MKKNVISFAKVLFLSLCCTVALFAVHYIFSSMLNLDATSHGILDYRARINHGFIQEVYEYHIQHPAFIRRPITSFSIDFIHRILDISYANAFIFVNFFVLFLCGVVLFYLAKALKQKERNAYLSVLFFYLSFSILFAFFIPVYSYDEPFQYLFLFLTLLCLFQKQWIPFAISFFFALMARETTIFLVPGLFLLLLPEGRKPLSNITFLRSAFSLILTVIGYVGALWYFASMSDYGAIASKYFINERFSHWMFNFQSWQYSLESIVSFVLVLGLPLAIAIGFINHFSPKKNTRRMLLAFVLTVFINSFFVFFSAKAQESRLFALPLIFFWPILGKAAFSLWRLFQKNLRHIKRSFSLKKGGDTLIVKGIPFILIVFLLAIFSFGIYSPMNGKAFSFGYQLYLFFENVLILGFLLVV